MDKSQVLRTVEDVDLAGKNVLIRLDIDVPIINGKVSDDSRLLMTWPTVETVLAAEPKKVTIIGHLGRPLEHSTFNIQHSTFSLEPVRKWYGERLARYKNWEVWENLRFNPGEEANSLSFVKEIVRRSEADVFVFEAFATAHEPHASIISVPKLVPETVIGFRFLREIQNLSKIWQSPKRPVVFVLGGAKLSTKLPLVEKLLEAGDKVLLGGKFPNQSQISNLKSPARRRYASSVAGGQNQNSKLKIAELNRDGTDISERSAREFAEVISGAGTVVWNGPMGAFEKNSHKSEIINHKSESQYINTPAYGTYIVARAMRETGAFTVAGGGDTEAALTKLGVSKGIDWISAGGGAMLYYLAHRTLPFLEALKERPGRGQED